MRNTEWASPTVQPPQVRTPSLMDRLVDLSPHQPPERDAVLTIDAEGRITACTLEAKELLGWESECPEGCAVTTVIPELPFSAKTPGYNLAYAVFHSANGMCKRRVALLADGRKALVDIAMSSVVVELKRYITLSLRLSRPEH